MRRREAGLTLLEILVALVVLALVGSVALQLATRSLRQNDAVDARLAALAVARSVLESAGVDYPLAPGRYRSPDDASLRWSVQVDAPPAQDSGASGRRVVPYALTVTVTWTDRARPKALTVQAVRLGPPP